MAAETNANELLVPNGINGVPGGRIRRKSTVMPPMPWFGMDIGGTLTKLVYFEPQDTKFLDDDESHEHRPFAPTGGGAVKYAREIKDELAMSLQKSRRVRVPRSRESSWWPRTARTSATSTKTRSTSGKPGHLALVQPPWCSDDQDERGLRGKCFADNLQYPYVLVQHRASGVSVMVVRGEGTTSRGFPAVHARRRPSFTALCRSPVPSDDTFEEAIELATRGDNHNVDKLVKDIYGRGYDSVGTARGDGGRLVRQKAISAEGRARACARGGSCALGALVTTANNIGSITLERGQSEQGGSDCFRRQLPPR
ncbi:Pantothenate kinase [Aphelenchoides fujianensis]|nr:Pantothenate kinase [Aphelenchoides fujianensis]